MILIKILPRNGKRYGKKGEKKIRKGNEKSE